MRLNRRGALALLGLGAASSAAAKAASAGKAAFNHGVASGDPGPDRVVIWTRITPEAPDGSISYRWKLTPTGSGGVRRGKGVTGPDRDYTVKVDVTGLKPGQDYTYAFEAGEARSPVGRTRTLPATGTKDVVLAIASCSLFPAGYFNAYQAIADLPRVDAVLHMGDYIYEYGGPGSYGEESEVGRERRHQPEREILQLSDYRERHAQYKTDPALQAAHARAAWIVAWDDHETANNSYGDGAENHQPAEEGDWTARKAAALKAYYEWMPIREPAQGQSLAEAAARSFRFGDLAQLIMLETRLTARDKQLTYEDDLTVVDDKPDIADFRSKLNDPKRRMMSPVQDAWLGRELSASVNAGHAWQVIGSAVVMGRLLVPDPETDLPADALSNLDEAGQRRLRRMKPVAQMKLPYGLDMWDGYPVDRERVYDQIKRASARPIVVSGDSHAFWANELADKDGRRVACEFGGAAVTSPGADDYFKTFKIGPAFAKVSPEVVFNDQGSKGFVLLTLTRTEARGDMMAVSTIATRSFTTSVVKSFRAVPEGRGISGLTEV